MTISATDILVPVCSKIPLLYLLTQKVAQKFGYVLGIGKFDVVDNETSVRFVVQNNRNGGVALQDPQHKVHVAVIGFGGEMLGGFCPDFNLVALLDGQFPHQFVGEQQRSQCNGHCKSNKTVLDPLMRIEINHADISV